MKKILCTVLVGTLLFSLTACSQTKDNDSASKPNTETVTTEIEQSSMTNTDVFVGKDIFGGAAVEVTYDTTKATLDIPASKLTLIAAGDVQTITWRDSNEPIPLDLYERSGSVYKNLPIKTTDIDKNSSLECYEMVTSDGGHFGYRLYYIYSSDVIGYFEIVATNTNFDSVMNTIDSITNIKYVYVPHIVYGKSANADIMDFTYTNSIEMLPVEVTYNDVDEMYNNMNDVNDNIDSVNFGLVSFTKSEIFNDPAIAWSIVEKLNHTYPCTGFVPYINEQIDLDTQSGLDKIQSLSARQLSNSTHEVDESYEFFNMYGYTFTLDDYSYVTVFIYTEENKIDKPLAYSIEYTKKGNTIGCGYATLNDGTNVILPSNIRSKEIGFTY